MRVSFTRGLAVAAMLAALVPAAFVRPAAPQDAPTAADPLSQVEITVDDSDPDRLTVQLQAPVTPEVTRQLVLQGLGQLLSSTAYAKPGALKGGKGQGGGAPPPVLASNLVPEHIVLGASTLAPGASLHVGWDIRNQGNAAADASSTTVVRITASASDPTGTDLASAATGALAAAATQAESADLTAPATPGTYYVWILADAAGAVTNQSSTDDDRQHSLAFAVEPETPPPPVNVANAMILSNKSGVAVTNYPLQFGRPFICGEIPHFPQVLVNNTPVTTQANVKNRCPDGSVKYAVLAVVVPSLPASGTTTLSFQDQSGGNTTALSKAQMLDPAYDFDATMALAFTGGANGSASARAMLTAGDYTLWTSGQIAQTVAIADDTVARKYDLGNGDAFHPFRPRFYATFWPALHKVQVRYVGENGLTTEIEDLKYALTLTLGSASPATVYAIDLTGGTTNNKLHWALTNWTKQFWIGGTPEQKINIDYGLSYLSATKYFPNYDTALVVPDATLAARYAAWIGKPNDLYDATWNAKGNWQSGMASPGARAEIAPYPEWTALWLYTGDWRLRAFSLMQADLASAFPANLRESDPTKRLNRSDAAGSGTGLGHVLSLTDRRTICLFRSDLFNWSATLPADRAKVVGPFTQKWSFDGAHEPAPFYPQYILTGDPYYLDRMYMWAGFEATRPTQAQRGPTGAEGGIWDELRGFGWITRNRAEAAFAAPDADPEKVYFSTLTDDALAKLEGGFKITGTVYDGNPSKVYGTAKGDVLSANGGPVSGQPPTLHNWESNGNPLVASATVTNNEAAGVWQSGTVGSFTSPWMLYYVLYGLGRTEELGFAADPLLAYTGQWLTDVINNIGNPLLVVTYQTPVERRGGGFMTWDEILTQGFTASYLTTALPTFFTQGLIADGRQVWATPGLSYLVNRWVPGATAAQAWWQANVYSKIAGLANNPKWAIVPRL